MAKEKTKSLVARGEIVLGYDKNGKAKVVKPNASFVIDEDTADALIAGGFAYGSEADSEAEAEATKGDGLQ